MKEIVYIAMPYSADSPEEIQENIARAKEVAKRWWKKGYIVICPHANSAHFEREIDTEVFLEGYLQLLTMCDIVVMGEGWKRSKGARLEYHLAREERKKIVFEKDPLRMLLDDMAEVTFSTPIKEKDTYISIDERDYLAKELIENIRNICDMIEEDL